MQILNISVTNRPSKSITSLLYPIDCIEKVNTAFMLDYIQVNEAIPVWDLAASSLTLDDFRIVREVMYLSTSIKDEVITGLTLDSFNIVKDVRYLTQTAPVEYMASGLSLNDISARDVLIRYSVEPHSITSGFGDISLEIINEP